MLNKICKEEWDLSGVEDDDDDDDDDNDGGDDDKVHGQTVKK